MDVLSLSDVAKDIDYSKSTLTVSDNMIKSDATEKLNVVSGSNVLQKYQNVGSGISFKEIEDFTNENDQFFSDVMNTLNNHNLIVTGTVLIETDSNREEEIYYECLTPYGDKFLIFIDLNNRSVLFSYTVKNDDPNDASLKDTRSLLRASGKHLINSNVDNVELCKKLPECKKIYHCDGDSCTREGGIENYDGIIKSYMPDMNATIQYNVKDMPIPVIYLSTFLKNPREVYFHITNREIELAGMAAKNSDDKLRTLTKKSEFLTKIYRDLNTLILKNQEQSLKDIENSIVVTKQYIVLDKPMDDIQLHKLEKLKVVRRNYKGFMSLSNKFAMDISYNLRPIVENSGSMLREYVEMWLTAKELILEDENDGRKTPSEYTIALPDEIVNIRNSAIVSALSGGSELNEEVDKYLTNKDNKTKIENVLKKIDYKVSSDKIAIDTIKKVINSKKDFVLNTDLSDNELTLYYQLVGLLYLLELVENRKRKLDYRLKMAENNKCGENKLCLDRGSDGEFKLSTNGKYGDIYQIDEKLYSKDTNINKELNSNAIKTALAMDAF